VGARPLGLGESFTSVADDGNAVYWNPAGLPTLKRIEFNSMYANLYNIQGLRNIYLDFVLPLTPHYYIGASWFHFGFDDDELEFFRNKANLSFGANVFDNFNLGVNFKYLSTDARLDGFSEGKANGVGFDFGALYSLPIKQVKFLKQINLGLMVHDVGGTDIIYIDTKKSETILPQNIRLGFTLFGKEEISLKYFSLKDVLLTFEFDDRFHVGAETWLFDILGIRTGLQKDFNTDENITYSFGSSLKFPFLSMQLDYAYVIPPTLSSTHVFSFSFIPNVSPVKIIDFDINDLYASFYKSYAINDIGYVTLRNDYDKEIDITMKLSVPGLTEIATQESFILGPGKKQTSYFKAVFLKSIIDVRESEFRQAKLKIEYKVKNEAKYVEASKKFQLFGRGAITWEDPGKAVAFITKLDRMVELFSSEVTKDLPFKSEVELSNIYIAAALFDALGTINVKYKKDPENPFSMIPKSQHSVDHIKYPAELLKSKQGECDDLTVLYASMLESSGIKTALLSTTDHIWLMFDTGIHERNWGLLPLGDSLIVIKNKTLWIPVELTKVGTSFSNAWKAGCKKYREVENDIDFKVVTVKDVEGIYLSALPDEFQNQIPDLPNKVDLKKITNKDIEWINNKKTDFVIEHYNNIILNNPADINLLNKLGIIFAQQDSINQAEMEFKKILKIRPENPQALNNLSNIYLINSKFNEAEENYLKAEKIFENEPGIYLNLAILYQLWKTENSVDSSRFQLESEKYLLYAFELLKGNEIKALDLLAISGSEINFGQKAEFKSWIKKQAAAIKKFIKVNVKKYLFNKSVEGAQLERKAVKRGIDKDRSYILWWAF
jgi:tetratricopeptide (TPR) repeat protein